MSFFPPVESWHNTGRRKQSIQNDCGSRQAHYRCQDRRKVISRAGNGKGKR